MGFWSPPVLCCRRRRCRRNRVIFLSSSYSLAFFLCSIRNRVEKTRVSDWDAGFFLAAVFKRRLDQRIACQSVFLNLSLALVAFLLQLDILKAKSKVSPPPPPPPVRPISFSLCAKKRRNSPSRRGKRRKKTPTPGKSINTFQ